MSDPTAIIRVDRTLPPGTSYRITPEELLLAMARDSRDGMSRDAIRRKYELEQEFGVTDDVLERALARGRELLDRRIAEGVEPAESQFTVDLNDPKVVADLGFQSTEDAKQALLPDDVPDDDVAQSTEITAGHRGPTGGVIADDGSGWVAPKPN
jgi:hypothetical protein